MCHIRSTAAGEDGRAGARGEGSVRSDDLGVGVQGLGLRVEG